MVRSVLGGGWKMTVCEHGNVCREWMRTTGSYAPLVATCPSGCPFFKEKEPDVKKRQGAKRGKMMQRRRKGDRVRCADCIYRDGGKRMSVRGHAERSFCAAWSGWVPDDGFCHLGERKGE